jgi:hypothetical protein
MIQRIYSHESRREVRAPLYLYGTVTVKYLGVETCSALTLYFAVAVSRVVCRAVLYRTCTVYVLVLVALCAATTVLYYTVPVGNQ